MSRQHTPPCFVTMIQCVIYIIFAHSKFITIYFKESLRQLRG